MKLKRDPVESEIPTSSMADIAFLLIIFFMVTTVFSATKGLELKLPKDDEEAPPEDEEAIFLKVNADSSVWADCKPMEIEEILPYIGEKLVRNPEKPVIVYTDATAPYSAMIRVYDEIAKTRDIENNFFNKHGFKVKNLSVPTQSDIEEYIKIFGENPFETQCAGG